MEALILTIALAAPPCKECEALKVQAALKAVPQKAAPAVTVAPTVPVRRTAAVSTPVRVRSFFSIRTGDGPVRRLARSLRLGCH